MANISAGRDPLGHARTGVLAVEREWGLEAGPHLG